MKKMFIVFHSTMIFINIHGERKKERERNREGERNISSRSLNYEFMKAHSVRAGLCKLEFKTIRQPSD